MTEKPHDQRSDAAELTQSQLEELRRLLLAKRSQLLAEFERATEQLVAGDEREPEAMDRAEVDAAQDEHARRTSRDSSLLEEIEAALGRFDDASYGLSEVSGEPIGIERLRAVPWARRTVREERELERERRSRAVSSPRTPADRR